MPASPKPRNKVPTSSEELPAPTSTLAAGARIREVPAVRRAFAILNHLARTERSLTVTRIAADLDIIPSTCLHILRELMAAQMVAFEPNGKTYRLGFGVLRLAKALSVRDVFIQAAQARLEAFAQEHHVSVSAQQRDGDESVVVAAVTASEGLEAPLGRRVPALSAASGKIFAGYSGWTRTQLLSRFEKVRWQLRPDFETWIEEANETRETGYAVDHGNFRVGVTSISVAVPASDGSVWRTISVNVISAQLDPARSGRVLDALMQTARDISRDIADA